MQVRSRQDAKSVCIKRRHGAMSAGEVWKKSFVYYLKAVALIGLHGHGRGGKRIRGELSLVAAALSKIDVGRLCLYGRLAQRFFSVFTREGGICLSVVFASGVFSRCRNRTRPLNK